MIWRIPTITRSNDDREATLRADLHVGMGDGGRQFTHQWTGTRRQAAGETSGPKCAHGDGAFRHEHAGDLWQRLYNIVSAAQADGCHRGIETIVFAGGLACLAGNGAGHARFKRQANTVGGAILRGIDVGLDGQTRRWPNTDKTIIDHAGVYVAVSAGDEAVAFF